MALTPPEAAARGYPDKPWPSGDHKPGSLADMIRRVSALEDTAVPPYPTDEVLWRRVARLEAMVERLRNLVKMTE